MVSLLYNKSFLKILCCFLEYVWYNVIVIICSMNINIGKNKIPNNYVPSGGNSKKSIKKEKPKENLNLENNLSVDWRNPTYEQIKNYQDNQGNPEKFWNNGMDDLIYVNSHSLSTELCKDIIDRFEEDDRKQPGMTTSGIDLRLKNSTDLNMSHYKDEWGDIDYKIAKIIGLEYDTYMKKIQVQDQIFINTESIDTGYNIKKYCPGGYFNWHTDRTFNYDETEKTVYTRTLAFLWYLNDNFDEGYTEFAHGRKIQPKTGQLLIFPATWTFPHRGLTPKNGNKYIISSYMLAHDKQALYN